MLNTGDSLNIYESSKRLRDLRKQRGLSHYKLAREIGVSEQVLKNYEQAFLCEGSSTGHDKVKAIAGMKIETLYKLARYFNVSADYLLGICEQPTIDKDLNAVCEYTGLSQDSVMAIKMFSEESFFSKVSGKTEDIVFFNDCTPSYLSETLNRLVESLFFPFLLSYLAKYTLSVDELRDGEKKVESIKKQFENDSDYINETIGEYKNAGLFELREQVDLNLFRVQEMIKKIAKEITVEDQEDG